MDAKRKIYSVTEINRKVRMVLEGGVGDLWVEGELSRVTIHSSGHWYFTLKDASAAVSCAMFSRENRSVGFRPQDGKQIRILARPSLYEANGRYQLIATKMEDVGAGNLQERFEKLKNRLKEEGLFDPEHKKPLPLLPRKIGVVTSPTGAAIQDILQVLIRRFPNIQVLLAPVHVQGAGAEKGIVKAIDYLNTRDDLDLLIVGRGGGSLEDLWCFNEEELARAIYRSRIPVISAVGHEIDFTISDMVADLRAPTPSAAAELAVPRKADLLETLDSLDRRLLQTVRRAEQQLRLRLTRASQSYVFREPAHLIRHHRQKTSSAQTRMADLLQMAFRRHTATLDTLQLKMEHALLSRARQAHQRIDELDLHLRHHAVRKTEHVAQQFSSLQRQLHMLDPLAVLGRGYSLTSLPDGTIVRSATQAPAGQSILIRLAEGSLESTVQKSIESSAE